MNQSLIRSVLAQAEGLHLRGAHLPSSTGAVCHRRAGLPPAPWHGRQQAPRAPAPSRQICAPAARTSPALRIGRATCTVILLPLPTAPGLRSHPPSQALMSPVVVALQRNGPRRGKGVVASEHKRATVPTRSRILRKCRWKARRGLWHDGQWGGGGKRSNVRGTVIRSAMMVFRTDTPGFWVDRRVPSHGCASEAERRMAARATSATRPRDAVSARI